MFKLNKFIKFSKTYCRLKKTAASEKQNATKNVASQEDYPSKLLTKKHKTPANFYITTEKAADFIFKQIEPFLDKSTCDTAIEMNPGFGLFTRKLLSKSKLSKIIAMEPMEHFKPRLQNLQLEHKERLILKTADMSALWKLTYQDKLDNGSRVPKLLEDLPRSDFQADPRIMLFGAVGSHNFYKDLINTIIFQNGLTNYGRCEMYLIVPPPVYVHLTCTKEIGFMIYRATSILFQILYEYRFITKLDRDDFLPKQTTLVLPKRSKLKKLNSIDPNNLYLVQMRPRKDVFELCPPEDLHALWYFIKQNCVSRRNRIIPNLEKYVPGCGPRLIINEKCGQPISQLYNDEDPTKLPTYSKPCTTMHNQDFYKNMTIFTQFGDLSPSQQLSLFTQFRQWPEYKTSAFLASLENSVLKLETTTDALVLNEEEEATEEQTAKNL